MNTERLLKLAAHLRTEELAKHFSMDNYFASKHASFLDYKTPKAFLQTCGAVACWDLITPAIAADVVEHLAATGEVVWPEEVYVEDDDQ